MGTCFGFLRERFFPRRHRGIAYTQDSVELHFEIDTPIGASLIGGVDEDVWNPDLTRPLLRDSEGPRLEFAAGEETYDNLLLRNSVIDQNLQ